MGNVLVAAFGAGGAGSVLAAALMKFFSRHRGKKVVFGVNGKVRSIQGYSAAEVERVIKATQLAMEQPFNQELDHVKEQLEQLLPDTSYMTLREEEDPGDSSPEWSSCAPSD